MLHCCCDHLCIHSDNLGNMENPCGYSFSNTFVFLLWNWKAQKVNVKVKSLIYWPIKLSSNILPHHTDDDIHCLLVIIILKYPVIFIIFLKPFCLFKPITQCSRRHICFPSVCWLLYNYSLYGIICPISDTVSLSLADLVERFRVSLWKSRLAQLIKCFSPTALFIPHVSYVFLLGLSWPNWFML